ncbi:rhomboid family intramembrane serine protease [Nocardioides acrostichi]|uniref:Rhomboid family intramembrane serine protease n=1 Tax=Nocardioides acrostichi TaxID=2784339 RepID=A0A930V5A1_9ACTN|nr:rhomboid family intramembrane serine protease [Nocardioides acrostichi]MBF4163995.1 rhomboid family intramembrane serine protease [Nocardioides acrostichi]
MSLTQQTRRAGTWPTALAISLGFVALLWVIELADQSTPTVMDSEGIRPRTLAGLSGVLFAPLLHAGWGHLIGNSFLVGLLFFAVLVGDISRGVVATIIVWAVSGLGVWLIAPSYTVTVGASGLIFGWLTYLLLRGFFSRSWRQLLVGLVLFVAYGSVLLGVLPGAPGVSWQAHFFGAVGGAFAAVALGRRERRERVPSYGGW